MSNVPVFRCSIEATMIETKSPTNNGWRANWPFPGIGKTGDGIDAIKWWREKRILEIAEYCCFDVKVTRLVHEFGSANKEIFYMDKFNRRQKIPIGW